MFHILLEINLNEMLTRGQKTKETKPGGKEKKKTKIRGVSCFFCLFVSAVRISKMT